MAAIIFVILHFIVCIVTGVLWKKERIKTRNLIFPAVVFLPVWGILLLVLEEYEERRAVLGTKEIGIEDFKIRDVKYQRISVDEGKNADITVPLEEAILVNDATVRRRLMMDVLQKGPKDHIELLQKARNSDDTELTHYATTAMLEIQGRYESGIHALSEDLRSDPSNVAILRRLRRELVQYIDSGLISGNIMLIYRRQLSEVDRQLTVLKPQNRTYAVEYLRNQMAMGMFEGIEEELKQLLERFPKEEQICDVMMEYYWQTKQGEQIKQLLAQMKKDEMYLSHEAKVRYAFWQEMES